MRLKFCVHQLFSLSIILGLVKMKKGFVGKGNSVYVPLVEDELTKTGIVLNVGTSCHQEQA